MDNAMTFRHMGPRLYNRASHVPTRGVRVDHFSYRTCSLPVADDT